MDPTLIETWTKIFPELVAPAVAIIALIQYSRSVRISSCCEAAVNSSLKGHPFLLRPPR